MKNYLNNLPQEIQDLIHLSGAISLSKGMPVYLIGGFVRDLLLGVKNLDLDMAVEGDGIAFAEELSARFNAKLIRHRRFGTATVILKPNLKIDIATARKEIYPESAELPVVEFGILKDDLKRRDFTINAMAIDITESNFGGLIDFFDGKKDVIDKKIKILHELSFIDDPTRILRAIRFETRYNFKIGTKTLRLLREAVKKRMLEKVEPQRLREELILILKEDFPGKQIRRMQQLTGLGFISSGLAGSKIGYDLLDSAAKELQWFKKKHFFRRKIDVWLIYFMALIDRLSLKEAKKVCRKFVFSNGEEKRILSYKKIGAKFVKKLSKKEIKPFEIFGLFEPLSYEAILLIKAKYRSPVITGRIEDFLEIYNDIRVCISGHHLHGLGVAPGPHYKKIFDMVLKAKINGVVKTEEEELRLINKYIKNNKRCLC
jgi:tRNA nucleotidyltransferase (CCA-adding enzyme)